MKRNGLFLLLTAWLHIAVGLALYFKQLGQIAAVVFNSVDPYSDRGAAFWYILTGLFMLLLAMLMRWVERQQLELPRFVGWCLTGYSVVGAVLMPISGFWLVIPQGIMLLVPSKSAAKREQVSTRA